MLTKEQLDVKMAIIEDLISRGFPKISHSFDIKINGYAGTGKTFLLANIRKELFARLPGLFSAAFCTYTGKASSVILSKLEENQALFPEDYVGTIHGLIYKVIRAWDKDLNRFVIKGFRRRSIEEFYHNIIFVDEASMVSQTIWDDLHYFGVPIIAVGDHGQLPPIGDDHNPMQNSNYTLTEIHRQALNSPILKLADFARKYGYIPRNKTFGDGVFKIGWGNEDCKTLVEKADHEDDMIMLCGFNHSRINLNKMAREKLGYKFAEPYIGERVICLQNNRDIGIMNGQLSTVVFTMPGDMGCLKLTIDPDGFEDLIECYATMHGFNNRFINTLDYLYTKDGRRQKRTARDHKFEQLDFFDFGYAISVHKSQGSEWRRVILFEQFCKAWSDTWNRWLYTAITRAREKLFIVSDFY
jgi:hypothetical protein